MGSPAIHTIELFGWDRCIGEQLNFVKYLILPLAPWHLDGYTTTYLLPPGINYSYMIVMVNGPFVYFFQSRFRRRGSAAVFLHLAVYSAFCVDLEGKKN